MNIGAALGRNLMLAPMVVFMRLPVMAAEAGDAGAWGTETALAFNEKAAALAEGVFAAQMSLLVSASRFWPEFLSGRTPSICSGAAIEHSLNAALRPAGRRVRISGASPPRLEKAGNGKNRVLVDAVLPFERMARRDTSRGDGNGSGTRDLIRSAGAAAMTAPR